MTEPAMTDLIAELTAADDVLDDLIKGHVALLSVGLGDDTTNALQADLAMLNRRSALISNAVIALTALDADAYPVNPIQLVDAAVIKEIEAEIAAITAALGQFTDAPPTP